MGPSVQNILGKSMDGSEKTYVDQGNDEKFVHLTCKDFSIQGIF